MLEFYYKRSRHLLVCDGLDIDSKVLIGKVKQVTKNVIKSEV